MSAKYQAYAEYKDSGVEWLGKIPSQWSTSKFTNYIEIRHGFQFRDYDFTDEGIKIIKITQLDKRGHIELSKCSNISASRLSEFPNIQIKEKDILMCLTGGTIGKIVRVGKVDEPLLQNYRVGHFSSSSSLIIDDYVYYLMSSSAILDQINFLLRETGQPNIGMDDFGQMKICVPELDTQKEISSFLDHETAKIDTLIEKQQQLIKLLKEKRQAVISHAVTKGLNPNAPMCDSGVEWLGKVPEHWNKSSLGFECSVKARLGWKGLKAEEYVDEGYIFIATPNIKGTEIDFDNVNYITKERYYESPEIMLEVGDVLITKDGSTTGTTNVVRNLPAPTTVNSSIAVLRSAGKMDSLYLYYFFVSTYTQNNIKRMQGGMGVPHLFQADLKKFDVLMPSLDEQCEIVNYIEIRLPKFDLLIEKGVQEVTLLNERRTALISAAVTGKIDVRNWQAPNKENKGVKL